jgi:cell wall-associated NlpC family hydrolase
MSLDGIQGVQARIQEINQIIASTAGASSSTDANASSSAATSPEFASLLQQALATGGGGSGTSGSNNPLSALTGLTGGGSDASGASSLMSELSSLFGGTQSSLPVLGMPPTSTTPTMPTMPTTYGSSSVAQTFLQQALAQQGKKYIYGADPPASNADPSAFDCEGLTRWAAARVGIDIPMGATFQYRFLEQHGTTMSVDQALHTPGALLFHFGSDPNKGVPPDGHVGISVGDGVHVMEAKGHAYGTNVFADASHFNYAGMIPGM